MKHFTLPKEGGLIETGIPSDILHSYEKIRTEIYDQSTTASEVIADTIIDAINASKEKTFKLGLSTGVTPVSLYKWLTRKYQEGKVSFKNVEVYSIDEYYPYGKGEPQSRNNIIPKRTIALIILIFLNFFTVFRAIPVQNQELQNPNICFQTQSTDY